MPVIVPTAHFVAFSILENNLIGYAEDSTLMAVVPLWVLSLLGCSSTLLESQH